MTPPIEMEIQEAVNAVIAEVFLYGGWLRLDDAASIVRLALGRQQTHGGTLAENAVAIVEALRVDTIEPRGTLNA